MSTEQSPDDSVKGFLPALVDALRYDRDALNPDDSAVKIAEHISDGQRVLDIGCGSGVVAAVLKEKRGCHVVGIEPDAGRAKVAVNRGIRVYYGVLTEALLREIGTFDVVVFADVLEHLADPASLVLLARTALSDRGKILASIPNAAHWSMRRSLLFGRFEYEPSGIMDATHLRWFTMGSIIRFFERLGFQIVNVDYTSMAHLPVYTSVPWKWLGFKRKSWLLGRLVRAWPTLFAAQFIIEALPVRSDGS